MLRQRVITAALLGGVLLAVVLLLPPWASVALFTLTILFGAWEWSGFMRAKSLVVRMGFVALIAVALLLSHRYVIDRDALQGVLWIAALWWMVTFLWVALAPQRVSPLAAAIAGVLVLVPAWIALVHLRTAFAHGALWSLFVLGLAWAADTGAFFAGKFFGRVPLAPRVSPKKTWEGAVGGVCFGALAGYLASFALPVQPLAFVLLSASVAAISIVGDLTESMLKRAAGMKDSGWLFPGHGGVLDRIDSVTAAAPAFLLGVLVFRIAT
ncbi:MAG: phosphatidate cytidylyltransferase [Pseudomonadales bacterium]|nr:phosphatidate cytidylyltransferase [Pseudomonadales bacterium]